MRSSTNTLIANMAFADLLMTIDIPYILKFFYVGDKWFGTFMGTVLCKFFHSAQVGSLIASVFSLVAISLDRSFAILFPMKTVMTRNVVRFAIAMVWLGALAFSLPVMVASKTAQLEGTNFLSCAEFWATTSANTFFLVLIIGGYIIPLIIIAFVYSLAGIRLWSRQLPGHRNLVSNKKAQSSSRRATAMLITVVIVFALSWLPFQALEMLRQYNRPLYDSLPIEFLFTTPWFGYANSAINPILYVIFSENYRQEFYRILCRGPTRKDRYRRTIISRSTTTRSTRLSRASSLAVSIPLQKLREEANYRRQGPDMASNNTLFFTESVFPNITNNATEPGSGGSYSIPPNIQIGVTIFAVLIFIFALIGNIVVIYIVCTVNHMRSSTNTLIANMAVADLLMTIDIPYILKFFYVRDKWFGTFMGTVLCKFFHSAQVGSLIASVFSLVAISLDRSFAILFPMKTVMTRNVVRFAIAMVWLGALAFSLPVMVVSKTAQLEGTNFLSCAEFWAPTSANTFFLVLIIGGYIIPLIIIAFVYSLAGIRLWSRQLPGHRNLVSNKKAQSSSRRATAMLITVVIVFALSWLPFQALEMLRQYNRPLFDSLPIELLYTTPWFGYANSAINPILYVIFSENYRQEFYRILCRGPTRKDRYRRTIISRSTTTRSTRLSRASSLAVSIPLQKLREEANYRRQGPDMASNNTLFFTESVFPNITNNATEPGSGGSYSIPPNIQIGVTIFAVLIFIFALIGNIVVIYIVCTVNHMRSSTNTLIANMAVADLLMTIDIPYILKFFYVRDKWFGTFMGTVLCKFFFTLLKWDL
ncbi:unnamed protein product [Porites lobata]|uniref:G-protein coupled receptors family 1 profile domain-containing protein n=1 Tax=Porites lobata TaxID=104759 RepID=A0ABN8RBH7_9CNID|nr:unnamed protein product [Porites lobata]